MPQFAYGGLHLDPSRAHVVENSLDNVRELDHLGEVGIARGAFECVVCSKERIDLRGIFRLCLK